MKERQNLDEVIEEIQHSSFETGIMDKVIYEYDDSIGRHHLIVSVSNGTGDVYEYVSVIHCPNCGKKFTENMICECSKNNTDIRL